MNAIFQKQLDGWRGDVALFKLEPPLEKDGEVIDFVAVSSVNHSFAHETMIFRSNPEGEVTDFLELACIRELSHSDCLLELGYRAVWS